MPNDAEADIRKYIAGEIRAEMARQGITTPKLAARVGKNRMTMWELTHGRRGFRVEELALTAQVLGVPVSQFLPKPGGEVAA